MSVGDGSVRLRGAADKLRRLAEPIAAWEKGDEPVGDEYEDLRDALRRTGFDKWEVAIAVAAWLEGSASIIENDAMDVLPFASAESQLVADLIITEWRRGRG